MNISIIEQFIPILIIFILLSYPRTVIQFSHSILGRFLAVSIIIFYSSLDKYLGLLVCGLVIFYYQMDYVEGMMAEINENFDNITNIDIPTIINNSNDTLTTLLNNSYKQFTYYNDLYKETPISHNTNKLEHASVADKEVNHHRFKKENCDEDGNLIYKNSIINLEMIEFLFPEIKFSKNKCNPCDNNCQFTILEKKLVTEEKMKPISTIK